MYDSLAGVYEFLVPEALLSPEGSAAAFDAVLEGLPAGARVLDCACGTGTLAVGLALRGFEVDASDASAEMVVRTRALAQARGARVQAEVARWDELAGGPFDAVLCVGNSITHAPGPDGRRASLSGMRRVVRDGGLLAVTSRNWERPQAAGEEVVERGGRRASVRRAWHDGEPRRVEIEVRVEGAETHRESLAYWPFTHAELDADLRAAGFRPEASTWTAEAERYLVTSRAKRSNASR
jgi:SAM-dependent methyltransferase